MTSYYPKGELFFVRSTLKHPGAINAEKEYHVHGHVLIEYQWSGWTKTKVEPMKHPPSVWETGRGVDAQHRTLASDFDMFHVRKHEGEDSNDMFAVTRNESCLNWNECHDRNNGGPGEYLIRPFKRQSKQREWLRTDAIMQLRAIYFPLCHTSEEAYKNYRTYLVIDFKARESIECVNRSGGSRTLTRSREYCLRIDLNCSCPEFIVYLATFRKLGIFEHGTYQKKEKGAEMFAYEWFGTTRRTNTHKNDQAASFHRQIDLAGVLNATFSAEVGLSSYENSSVQADPVTNTLEFGFGFVPGIGPLLSPSFSIDFQLLEDPDKPKAHSVLDLGNVTPKHLMESVDTTTVRKFLAKGTFPKRIRAFKVSKKSSSQKKSIILASGKPFARLHVFVDIGDVHLAPGVLIDDQKKVRAQGEAINTESTKNFESESHVAVMSLEKAIRFR